MNIKNTTNIFKSKKFKGSSFSDTILLLPLTMANLNQYLPRKAADNVVMPNNIKAFYYKGFFKAYT